MGVIQGILSVEAATSYFSLDRDAELTPSPYIDSIGDNLFTLDLATGDLSPNNDDFEDVFFEVVNGEITPKVL